MTRADANNFVFALFVTALFIAFGFWSYATGLEVGARQCVEAQLSPPTQYPPVDVSQGAVSWNGEPR